MNAIDVYNLVKTMLEDDYDLREIPNLMLIDEVKESHTKDGFILQPTGTTETEYANRGLLSSYVWQLEIVFKNVTATERVQKFDIFNSIKQSLQQLTGFTGFEGETTFGRLANFTFMSLGTINFQFGIEGSC